jgi:predicted regulator of Ras-like GTPase activity (Roadblock/LC7/MglB family)
MNESSALHISPEQFRALNETLLEVYQRTKCIAIVLVDSSGTVISRSGTMPDDAGLMLATLAAANFAASTEMAKLVGESAGFAAHFHEGEQSSIYITGVSERFVLVIVFSKRATTFGMVRLLAAKAIERLGDILATCTAGPSPDKTVSLADGEFQEELSARLSRVLHDKGGASVR